MAGKSKRTTAPTPLEFPWSAGQLVRPPTAASVPPPTVQPIPAIPSMYAPGIWLPPRPPQSMAASSPPCWVAGVHQPGMAASSAQGPWWRPPAESGCTVQPTLPAENLEEYDLQAWGLNSHPPGGSLSFFTNTSSHKQGMGNGTSSQPINVGNDINGDGCARTEKRLTWTKEEDLRLVSAWLNNSNDPIQSNYKKNEQYWKEVAAVYNSTTPKNRARLVKQVKDRFGRIKKKVAWFCAELEGG